MTRRVVLLVLASTLSLLAIIALIIRYHSSEASLGWSEISKVEILQDGVADRVVVTDEKTLSIFQEFGIQGKYRVIEKAGFGYRLRVWKANNYEDYYVHGDCLGKMPGGFVQEAFFPDKAGFDSFIQNLFPRKQR